MRRWKATTSIIAQDTWSNVTVDFFGMKHNFRLPVKLDCDDREDVSVECFKYVSDRAKFKYLSDAILGARSKVIQEFIIYKK